MDEFQAYRRVLTEVGGDKNSDIHHALIELMPCAKCGAGVGRPCVTVDGKNPGTPTAAHIWRVKYASRLYYLWVRMASEAFESIEKKELPCLEKLKDKTA